MKRPIAFVVYFSSAQEKIGTANIWQSGSDSVGNLGGSPLRPGVYQISDQGELVWVRAPETPGIEEPLPLPASA